MAAIAASGGVASAESSPTVQLDVEASVGHVELGTGHGHGVNAFGMRAIVGRARGLFGQLTLTGLRAEEHVGAYTAATVGYRSGGRAWFRVGGGFGVVFYERIDRMLGGTQSGSPRAPADRLAGLGFSGAGGVDLVRKPSQQLYVGIGIDALIHGPQLAVASIAAVIGVRL